MVGDELCVYDQCFNFVKYDSNGDIVLLAKYNLNVGPSAKSPATGAQDSGVRGDWYVDGVEYDYGRVNFSTNSHYWYDWDTYEILPKYGDSFPLNIYDDDLNGAPGTRDYSIAYYVQEYQRILEGYGAQIKASRLLTYDEAKNTLGCTFDVSEYNGLCPSTGPTAFVSNTDYWLGTARYEWGYVYRIYFDHTVDEVPSARQGVRPVIVITKNSLK